MLNILLITKGINSVGYREFKKLNVEVRIDETYLKKFHICKSPKNRPEFCFAVFQHCTNLRTKGINAAIYPTTIPSSESGLRQLEIYLTVKFDP